MRLRDRLLKGTVLNLIAVVFNQGSTFAVNIVVARILMKQGFGEYAIVQSTLLTMSTLSQLATGYTAAKYVAEYRTVDPLRAGRIMGVCARVSVVMAIVGTILLIAMAPWLADTMLKAPHLEFALIIGSGFIFFSSINGYQTGALSGLEAYRSLVKAGVISGIVTVAVISLCAWYEGLNGAILGLGVSAFFRFAIHHRWLRIESRVQGIKPKYRGNLSQERTVILKFAIPAAMAGYYSIPMIWFGNSILVRQPGGYEEMASYAVAINIKSLLLFAPIVISSVVSSILNNIKGSGNKSQYMFLYKYNVAFVFLTTLTTALVLGAFSTHVLGIFGKGFIAGKTILLIVLASGVFEAVTGSIYQLIQNAGRLWLSFISINLPLGPLFLISAFFLIPIHGAIGLGIANVIMTFLSLFLTAILAYYINRRENLGTQ